MKEGSWRQARQDARTRDRLAGVLDEAVGPQVIDISPLVNAKIASWPGDVPYKMAKASHIDKDGIDIGSMHTSFHVGAHTDAHRHYAKDGPDAATMPLDSYFGPCEVVDVRARRGKRFSMGDLNTTPTAPRVLFKTGTFPDPYSWNDDFAAPEPSLIDALAAKGVVLVGFDTPSTDLFASKGLEAHKRLFANGMVNLEGLVLKDVKAGPYTLMALPLRLEGADASPVRAVLVPD